MTKSELVERIAAANPDLYGREIEQMVNAIFDEIMDILVSGGRVELRGFGTFFVVDREARNGRNPRTGESVAVEAKTVPRFKISKLLVDRLNEG